MRNCTLITIDPVLFCFSGKTFVVGDGSSLFVDCSLSVGEVLAETLSDGVVPGEVSSAGDGLGEVSSVGDGLGEVQ